MKLNSIMVYVIERSKSFLKENKYAIILSLFGFLFLFSFSFDWPFITGDDIAYLRNFEGVHWVGTYWDMARPGMQLFYEIIYRLGAENDPFWYYLVKAIAFSFFLFFFYKFAEALLSNKKGTILATLFITVIFPMAFAFMWIAETRGFSTLFTIVCYWYFLVWYQYQETLPKKKRIAYALWIIFLFLVAASFNQTARFIPVVIALFLVFDWIINKKPFEKLYSSFLLLSICFSILILMWFMFDIANGGYGLKFDWQPYQYFYHLMWVYGGDIFYIIVFLCIVNILFWKNTLEMVRSWLQKKEKISLYFIFVISWFFVTFAYSGLYGTVQEERYAITFFVPFVLLLFYALFTLYNAIPMCAIKKWGLILITGVISVIIILAAIKTLNIFLILGSQNVAFNDAREYINHIDTGAVVIYQSGTDDLYDYNSANEFIRPGFHLQAILDAIEEHKNKTIYLVEYPEPWVSNIKEINEKELIQTFRYWPIEVKVYIYTGNKPINQDKNYSYQPHTGSKPLYYGYADEAETEKIFSDRIILTNKNIILIMPNAILRTILSPLTILQIKGRSLLLLEERSGYDKEDRTE